MTREIKFRAWDKDCKEWVKQTGNPYVFPFEGIVAMTCSGNGCGYISKEDYSGYYELSQFTGLHDKNGKEIYEGDIIEWCHKRQVVKATAGGWNPFIADMQTDGSWHYEVIGNLYENPELLK
jgi:uncharacterized phage protein (TIGR01671 family)